MGANEQAEFVIDEASFAAWFAQQVPPGTIISNPAWWVPRILRRVRQCAAAPTPEPNAEPVAWAISGPSDTLLVWRDPEAKIRELLAYHVNDTRDDYTVTPLYASTPTPEPRATEGKLAADPAPAPLTDMERHDLDALTRALWIPHPDRELLVRALALCDYAKTAGGSS
jgi:hypothetical protein